MMSRLTGMKQKKYDQELNTCKVLFSRQQEEFICAYCADSFTISQMDAVYGGSLLPITFEECEESLRFLRNYTCLMCDLPMSRSFD